MRELRYSDYYASYDELKYNSSYVHGNAALQLEPLEKERKRKKTKKSKLHVVKKKPTKDLYTKSQIVRNRMALTITLVALMAVSMSLIRFLELQATVSLRAAQVNELEEKYVTMKADNDLEQVRINSSIDYDKIFEVAVNDLGMVYANKDQVIVYNSEKMEVVKQLSSIPD